MDDTHDYLNANHLHDLRHDEEDPGGADGTGEEDVPAIALKLFATILFLIPFIFIPLAGWSAATGKVLVLTLLGTLAGVVVFSTLRRGVLMIPRAYTAILAGVAVVLILSTVFSDSISASLFGSSLEAGTFFTTMTALILAFIAPLIITSRKRLVMAMLALFAGGGVLALFHVARIIFGAEFLSFGYFPQPVSTPIGSWNDLGIFFGVFYLIALTSIMFGKVPRNLRNILVGIMIISLAFVLLVNFQLLSFVLAAVTLVLLTVSFITWHDQSHLSAVISLVFLLLLGIFSGPAGGLAGYIVDGTYSEIRPGWSSTQTMLGAGLSGAESETALSGVKKMTLGTGPNTFTYIWQTNRPQEAIDSSLWEIDFAFSTGMIPTFAITFGLLATALLLIFAGYLAWRVGQLIWYGDTNSLTATIATATGVGALFLWILALFYVFSTALFLLMFVLSGVAVAALGQMGQINMAAVGGNTRSGLFVRLLGLSVCVVFIAGTLLLATSRTLYGRAVVQANTAQEVAEIASAQTKMRQASILERNDDFARAEAELGLVRIQEFLARGSEVDERDLPELREVAEVTQQASERARRINPRNYLNWVNSGLVFETLGLLEVDQAFDFAEQSYARARELNPTNPELMLIQARLEQARGNTGEAMSYAQESAKLKSNYANAYLLMANIALENGNPREAITHLEAGIEATPNNSLLHYQKGLIHYAVDEFEPAISSFGAALMANANYANARYFRALAYVYGMDSREPALRDLEIVREDNPENEVLLDVIANIENGNEPLAGLTDESALPSVDEAGVSPGTNLEAVEELESQGAPQLQSEDGEDSPSSIEEAINELGEQEDQE